MYSPSSLLAHLLPSQSRVRPQSHARIAVVPCMLCVPAQTSGSFFKSAQLLGTDRFCPTAPRSAKGSRGGHGQPSQPCRGDRAPLQGAARASLYIMKPTPVGLSVPCQRPCETPDRRVRRHQWDTRRRAERPGNQWQFTRKSRSPQSRNGSNGETKCQKHSNQKTCASPTRPKGPHRKRPTEAMSMAFHSS